jgi:hypothetical protein
MKLNKWTVGLAAVGAISLSSAVQAEETEMNVVNAMTSGTTISGYVNTSFHYNLNTANGFAPVGGINRAPKANGFNLDVVNLTIEKPLDESEWAAGYKAELLFGPDANALATGSSTSGDVGFENADYAIKQAYVNLRAPVGNGLEFKMGVFDTIIGYEAFNANANPNYTRSYGWSIEPTQHTGLLVSYQISDIVSVAGGVADTWSATINDRPGFATGNTTKDQFNLTYLGAVSVTAPEDMGALAGSTLYAGAVYGENNGASLNGTAGRQANYYLGATVATGVEGLAVGAALDYVDFQGHTVGNTGSAWVAGLYTSFQATEKLSLHVRGEYGRGNSGFNPSAPGDDAFDVWEGTVTAQYDLWQNVITRLEYRWDNLDEPVYGDSGQAAASLSNGHALMLNVIYQF